MRHVAERSEGPWGGLRQLNVDLLRPGRYQPRRTFTPETLADLAESIRAEGVVQPIIVRPLPGTVPQRYEIIAGERRWRDADIVRLEQQVGEIVGTETRIDYAADRGRDRISFTFHSLGAPGGDCRTTWLEWIAEYLFITY